MPKTFSNTIYDKITRKAAELFPTDLLRSPASHGEAFTGRSREDFDENFKLWQESWFKAAEAVYKEFEAEGLTATCVAIREMIDWQKKHATRKKAA